ncbi:hypothetical protein M2140_001797 [Clostridiales Family XIII bacterium PM5-7]
MQKENNVVGYFKNHVIVADEDGELYYIDGERTHFELGTFVSDGLTPIDRLAEDEAEWVDGLYGNGANYIDVNLEGSELAEYVDSMPENTLISIDLGGGDSE